MKALLFKQFRLVANPTTYLFCLFPAMLLIPSYPYTVAFFYVTLGLFFTFQNGREQRDSDFTALLPVRKADSVIAAVVFCVIIQCLSLALAAGFGVLARSLRPMGGNQAGIDANMALLGFGFLVFGMFNGVFLPSFYRTGYKVGASFLKASIGVFVVVALDVVLPHVFPRLDGYDPRQWQVLAASAVFYGAVTFAACRVAVARYEKVDL